MSDEPDRISEFFDSRKNGKPLDYFSRDRHGLTILDWIFIEDDVESLKLALKDLSPEEIYKEVNEKCFCSIEDGIWGEPFETIDCFKYLVERGLDINTQDDHSLTALHYLGYCNSKFFCWFLENGADFNARDREGNTPIHIYLSSNFEKEINDTFEVLKTAQKWGFDLSSVNNRGENCLYYFSNWEMEDFLPVLDFLIQNGVDINTKDNIGDQFLAYTRGYDKILKMIPELFRRGFDFQSRNKIGQTALQRCLVVSYFLEEAKKIVKDLEESLIEVKEPEFN